MGHGLSGSKRLQSQAALPDVHGVLFRHLCNDGSLSGNDADKSIPLQHADGLADRSAADMHGLSQVVLDELFAGLQLSLHDHILQIFVYKLFQGRLAS